jgi:hypothetical protein
MFEDLEWYNWLAIGGGVMIVLTLLVYVCFRNTAVKVPAIVVSSLACLVAGAGVGIMILVFLDWGPKSKSQANTGGGGGGGGRGMMMPMMNPGQGGGQGQGPNSKPQLVTLVAKLEVLTDKPLFIQLTDKQKKAIHEQLKKLRDQKELSEKKAKEILEALQEILEDYTPVLAKVNAGQTGRGGRGGMAGGGRGGRGGRGQGAMPDPNANPFTEDANSKKLKSLEGRLVPKNDT